MRRAWWAVIAIFAVPAFAATPWVAMDQFRPSGGPDDQTGRPGPDLPMGFIESAGKPVYPVSLYRQQLQERLGIGALKALDR